MKKKIVMMAILLLAGSWAFSQCDKKVTWHTSKMEILDTTGKVIKYWTENSTVETSDKAFIITPNQDAERKMTGTVQNILCNWKDRYKNGFTTFISEIHEPSGEIKHGTIRIEAANNKMYLYMELKEMANMKFRVTIDSYEENP